MEQKCESAIQEIRALGSFDAVNARAVEVFVVLCFELLGGLPDNWSRRSPWADRYWTLSRFRTLHYTRAPEQLVNHILDRAQKAGKAATPSYDSLRDKLKGCRGDARKFLGWFREAYPERLLSDLLGDA